MSSPFPYTYISCPCSDAANRPQRPNRYSRDVDLEDDVDQEEKTFDPRHPRSNFSLFPPEHLLYCEECHDIKCPRCVTEEIICWFCPNCTFETPSSTVRNEGNRCARNCFDCPICSSTMTTAAIGEGKESGYILNCSYCMWNTLEIGIKFEKPTNIRSQLDKIANGGRPKPSSKLSDPSDPSRKSSLAREPFSPQSIISDPMATAAEDTATDPVPSDPQTRFHALKTFYKDQITISATTDSTNPASGLDLATMYSSPSSFARIMNLYTNIGTSAATSSLLKKSRQKPQPMREALTPAEGLQLSSTAVSTPNIVEYNSIPSLTQHLSQTAPALGSSTITPTHVSQLRPLPTLLRTKRAKRCRACKHILTKPELKPTSTRYRIRLLALNYTPLVTLKPLPLAASGAQRPPPSAESTDVVLNPGRATQWVLNMRNPLFERVKVSLGCPAVLPGPRGDKVTILCPQFEIGANSDVWDDALKSSANDTGSNNAAAANSKAGEQVAGKLYESGRNWVGVVLEIVPGNIVREEGGEVGVDQDEDVLEVPIRVRLEWRVSEEDGKEKGRVARDKLVREGDGTVAEEDEGRRELAYWMVLGVGRVGA